MSTAAELALLDENQRLKARVAELEGQLGQKLVKTSVWVEDTHHGRTAENWCVSYEILRDALFTHLGEFCFDDDCAEEVIFEDAIRRIGHALRLVKFDPELDAWVGAINLADFAGEVGS